MESQIASALRMEFEPVALIWTDEKPEQALEFAPGKWGCVMFHLAAAARGKTAVVSRDSFGCFGAGVGLGFGNQYRNFPGGEECFYRFLSTGNRGTQPGEAIGRQMEAAAVVTADEFLEGERYLKSPPVAAAFVDALPLVDIPAKYVVFKPLRDVDLARDNVRSITFLVNPDQLSALVVLAHYDAPADDRVTIPFAAGCQIIGIVMYREFQREQPRAVVGLTDISARKNVARQLGANVLSFSVAPSMFQQMESNVAGSFLERPTWLGLED